MNESGSSEITGIGQIGITVNDLKRSTAFYRDVLGLTMLMEAPGMSFFDLGDVRLMLGTGETPGLEHRAAIIYYRVGDITGAFRTLKERGAKVEREPGLTHRDDRHELWLAFLRDPDENVLALMSEVSAGQAGGATGKPAP